MVEELSFVREQLFDAPSEVKQAFNMVVNYFEVRTLYDVNFETRKGNFTTTTALIDAGHKYFKLIWRPGINVDVSQWRKITLEGLKKIGLSVEDTGDQREIGVRNSKDIEGISIGVLFPY